MKAFVTLDGEDLGELTLGVKIPEPGNPVMIRYKGEPLQAIVVEQTLMLEKGGMRLKCMRPETWRNQG